MRVLLGTVAVLAGQVLIGATGISLFALIRREPAWRRAARSLRRVAPIALVSGTLAALVPACSASRAIASPWAVGLWLVCAGGAATGLVSLLAAGCLESRGRLGPTRRLARPAGRLAARASLAGLAALAIWLFAAPRSGRPDLGLLALGGALSLAAGWAALLGGLSGKPRPSGQVAAALHVLGTACVVAAG